jgi:hypothetical protein
MENLTRKLYQYNLVHELIGTFASASAAAKKTNCKRKAILNCCKGKQKTFKGFIWSYCKIKN